MNPKTYFFLLVCIYETHCISSVSNVCIHATLKIQYVPLEIPFFISFLTEIAENPQEYSFQKSGVKCLFQMMGKKITQRPKNMIKDILTQYFSFITFSSDNCLFLWHNIHSFNMRINIQGQIFGNKRITKLFVIIKFMLWKILNFDILNRLKFEMFQTTAQKK